MALRGDTEVQFDGEGVLQTGSGLYLSFCDTLNLNVSFIGKMRKGDNILKMPKPHFWSPSFAPFGYGEAVSSVSQDFQVLHVRFVTMGEPS